LGNLATPKRVQKLQTALHATAKAEAGYRFYVLYDKVSREDILAHAYAQCRSNKSLPLRRQGAHRAWMARTLRPSRRMGLKGDCASVQAATRVNAEQTSKRTMCRPTR